jgi:hypothetical protein
MPLPPKAPDGADTSAEQAPIPLDQALAELRRRRGAAAAAKIRRALEDDSILRDLCAQRRAACSDAYRRKLDREIKARAARVAGVVAFYLKVKAAHKQRDAEQEFRQKFHELATASATIVNRQHELRLLHTNSTGSRPRGAGRPAGARRTTTSTAARRGGDSGDDAGPSDSPGDAPRLLRDALQNYLVDLAGDRPPSFHALHAAAVGLTGPEKLTLFNGLPAAWREAAWDRLGLCCELINAAEDGR